MLPIRFFNVLQSKKRISGTLARPDGAERAWRRRTWDDITGYRRDGEGHFTKDGTKPFQKQNDMEIRLFTLAINHRNNRLQFKLGDATDKVGFCRIPSEYVTCACERRDS